MIIKARFGFPGKVKAKHKVNLKQIKAKCTIRFLLGIQ